MRSGQRPLDWKSVREVIDRGGDESAVSLLRFCDWLSQTPFSVWLREAPYPYPVLLIIHIVTIALFGSMVVMGNLRVLGWAMQSVPVSEVITQFRPWKWTAFVMLLLTGLLLCASDPMEYYSNIMFWISNAILVAAGINALIFYYGPLQTVTSWDQAETPPREATRWARISLVLWIVLIFAGRAIAFF